MIKYYKDTEYTVTEYALKLVTSVFGPTTDLKRIAKILDYPQETVEEWVDSQEISYEIAIIVIKEFVGGEPEEYVTERNNSEDFILKA